MKYLWIIATFIFSQNACNALDIGILAADRDTVVERLNAYVSKYVASIKENGNKVSSLQEKLKTATEKVSQGNKDIEEKSQKVKEDLKKIEDVNNICTELKDFIITKLGNPLEEKKKTCMKDYNVIDIQTHSAALRSIAEFYGNTNRHLNTLVSECGKIANNKENHRLIACVGISLQNVYSQIQLEDKKLAELEKPVGDLLKIIEGVSKCLVVASGEVFSEIAKDIEDYGKCVKEASQLPPIPKSKLF